MLPSHCFINSYISSIGNFDETIIPCIDVFSIDENLSFAEPLGYSIDAFVYSISLIFDETIRLLPWNKFFWWNTLFHWNLFCFVRCRMFHWWSFFFGETLPFEQIFLSLLEACPLSISFFSMELNPLSIDKFLYACKIFSVKLPLSEKHIELNWSFGFIESVTVGKTCLSLHRQRASFWMSYPSV